MIIKTQGIVTNSSGLSITYLLVASQGDFIENSSYVISVEGSVLSDYF